MTATDRGRRDRPAADRAFRRGCPAISAAEYEARIADLLAAVDADSVVVYADREHAGEPRLPLQPRSAVRGGAARPRGRPADADRRQGGRRLRADRPDRRRRRLLSDVQPDGHRPRGGPTRGGGAARGRRRRGRPGRRRRLEGARAGRGERHVLADLRARVLRRHAARARRRRRARQSTRPPS